jgi:hypothetical protein
MITFANLFLSAETFKDSTVAAERDVFTLYVHNVFIKNHDRVRMNNECHGYEERLAECLKRILIVFPDGPGVPACWLENR